MRGQKGREQTDREKEREREEKREGMREERSILFGQHSSLLGDTSLVKYLQLHF